MKTHNRTYTLLTDSEIFGWHRPEPRRRKTEKTSRPPESDYADWREGEYVVHVDYGVGRFLGLKRRTLENTEREYLMIQYGGS
ncbi:MAG TPA: CarD family transcriptional regulator, partial [Aggregatilineales bacterium]|nr:CarD family transcriptional regulator [Aggregatilineales bacterium]